MGQKLAVSVALLPTQAMMEEIIDLIEYLPSSPIKLNTHSCLPHVTLAMGVIDEGDIDKAQQALNKLAVISDPIKLTLSETREYKTRDDRLFSDAVVSPTKGLVGIHLETMEAFSNLLSHENVETSMFFQPPLVAERSTYWVEHYYDKKTPQDFYPHFTLGQGKVKKLQKPIELTVYKLALCHLGTYCTCKRILAEVALR